MSQLLLKTNYAPLPETIRGKPFILRSHPKEEKIIYPVANSIVIRSINDPKDCEIISHHSYKVTAVNYSPSGFYIASGDISGVLKIWDTVNPEHLVKYEYQPLGGPITDISWSKNSDKILVVGDGKGKFSYVFSMDTGTSIGKTQGHNKAALTCDFRKKNPFSIVTGGEDFSILYYTGPPFVFKKSLKTHTNFVNCIRYSPNGDLLASAGQDGKIFIFDVNTMELKIELKSTNNKAHQGGVYSLCWNNDSTMIISASGDKTSKMWLVETGELLKTFQFGNDMMDQQLGIVWTNENIVSVQLSGKLIIFDQENLEKPKNIFLGHNKGIIGFCLSTDNKSFISSSFDGIINHWDSNTGICTTIEGNGFKNQVTAIDIYNNQGVACGVEDIVKFFSVNEKKFNDQITISMPSQPLSISFVNESTILVGCVKHIIVIVDKAIVFTYLSNYEVKSIMISSIDKNKILVGGKMNIIEIFEFNNNKLELTDKFLQINDIGTCISYSPNKEYLGIATSQKKCYVFNSNNLELINQWSGHNNRINSLSWSPNSQLFSTCGIDGNVNIWNPLDRFYRVELRNAHKAYNVSSVCWTNDNTVISVGQQDCTIKSWELK